MTQQERLIKALEARGSRIVPSKTRKYVVMSRYDGLDGYFYLGKAGALRVGKTIAVSAALENLKAALLREVV